MLYFIAVWILLLIACICIGIGVLHILQASNIERVGDRFIVAVWLGVIILSITLLTASLVIALSPLVGIFIASSLIFLSFLLKQTRQEIRKLWNARSQLPVSIFSVATILVAVLTTHQVTWYDTGYYHYGMIQWLSKFGAVPGIALLFKNLGFTSSWFALAAPLNADFFESRVSAITNGFIFLVFILHFLISLIRSVKREAELSDRFTIVFSTILILILAGSKSTFTVLLSPSPDVPIILLVGTIAWIILVLSRESEISLSHSKNDFNAEAIPLILAVGAVTIKLTALPLVFTSGLFYIFGTGSKLKRIFIGGAIITLLLAPLCVSSIVTSGCPLYPSSLFCLDLPWSPTADSIESIATNTYRWTNWSLYASSNSETRSWIWALVKLIQTRRGQLIVLMILASLFSASCIVKVLITGGFRKQIWVVAMGIVGIAFIMLTAPWFRFALPYLILLPSLLIAIISGGRKNDVIAASFERFSSWLQSTNDSRSKFVLLFFAVSTSIILISSTAQSSFFLPPPLKKVEVTRKRVNDVTYFAPLDKKDACWATEIPCSLDVPEDVVLLDPSREIAGGFARKR